MAVDEERELSEAYRTTRRVRRPEGQGLERPLRALLPHGRAPHRGEDRAGRGLLHLQLLLAGQLVRSRHARALSWRRSTSSASTTCTATSTAPARSRPTDRQRPQHLLHARRSGRHPGRHGRRHALRKLDHAPAPECRVPQPLGPGQARGADGNGWRPRRTSLYDAVEPVLPLGLPFAPVAVSRDWFDWPALPDLFPTSFPGSRPSVIRSWSMSILTGSRQRIADYFDPDPQP